MSSNVFINAIVEGPTEQIFLRKIIAPHLAEKGIFLEPFIATKKGQDGGDIKYERMEKDFIAHLKQRKDVYVTMFIDFYGIKEWPELEVAYKKQEPCDKFTALCDITMSELKKSLPKINLECRFIPYVCIHETEALYFSAPNILAEKLRIPQDAIEVILKECGEPEKINNVQETSPSHRLNRLRPGFAKKKTTLGLDIATAIGIATMREKCPLFNAWLTRLETLPPLTAGNADA